MSAKTVTDVKGTSRDAVLLAMQEAAEQVSGKKGVPKGPKGAKGIVVLSNDHAGSSPKDKKKSSGYDAEDEEDERSETSSVKPRNLSYSPAPKSPAKKSKAAWPPDEPPEEAEEEGEEDEDDDESGSRRSYEGIDVSLNHAKLYDWLQK